MATEIFTPKEVKVIIMGIERIVEDFESISKDASIPFTPDARKDIKGILSTAISCKKKLEEVINKGAAFQMAEYKQGDEDEFLTKQS